MRQTVRHHSGVKAAEGVERDGQREGAWTFWNEHGRREVEEEYEAGVRHGWHVRFHTSNQRKRAEGRFEGDQRAGEWSFWHENGEPSAQGEFRTDFF